MSQNRLSRLGALLADGTRAHILTVLMDGRAYTVGELAASAGAAASTTSEHLAKLLDSGMVIVESQGRHRYYALASRQVAALLETIGTEPPEATPSTSRTPPALAYARSCYDHLAGEVAVRVYDQLVADGHLQIVDHHPQLTTSGLELLADIGVDVATMRSARRATSRACVDWTQRRHHLAGAAGAALLTTMLDRGWAVRGSRPRSIRITRAGRQMLASHLGVQASC